MKALPLRKLSDVETIKREVKAGNILIVKVTPLVERSIEEVEKAVDELCEFAENIGGDIARLGEERIVICPSGVKIWRESPKNSVGG
ncbi:cell division protein SepF [Candidatus Bathyarchaeota archaeon]|nr:cell division protein SepF [Candidatus Bathyarchaeota archaeon]